MELKANPQSSIVNSVIIVLCEPVPRRGSIENRLETCYKVATMSCHAMNEGRTR